MASIVGTPTNITSGGSYTPESGSNRVVVFAAKGKHAGTQATLTSILYNGNSKASSLTGTDDTNGTKRCAFGFVVFKESELPGGSSTVTPTWSAATTDTITCYTLDGIDQTTPVIGTGSDVSGPINTPSAAISGFSIGDIIIGAGCNRSDGSNALTHNNSFTEYEDADGGAGGRHFSGGKVATSTSDSYSATFVNSTEQATGVIVLKAGTGGGGGGTPLLLGQGML